jgi:diguanylate cyclase (GGDEF)-like protein
MKNKLKIITNNTIVKLLKNDIILPSNYFKTFKEYADELDIDLSNGDENSEINQFLSKEVNEINKLMEETIINMDTFCEEANQAKKAILNNDTKELLNITTKIETLKQEMSKMLDNIFEDPIAKTNNTKWIYHNFLNNKEKLQDNYIVIYLNINRMTYINETYGEMIGNGTIKYVATLLKNKLGEEALNFELARYYGDKFLVFISSNDLDRIKNIIYNIKLELMGTTLKSNSGNILKIKFSYGIDRFFQNTNFDEMLGMLNNLEEEDKEKLK